MDRSKAPVWFPDWTGEQCLIAASGPSAKSVNLEIARGKCRVIAVNESYRLCPWADVLYACDFKWWVRKNGVPEFKGLKLSQDVRSLQRAKWNIHRVVCVRNSELPLFNVPTKIGWGGNSGFHCINLAAQFGVRKIILVGFDMRIAGGPHGVHWHGKHPSGLNNPNPRNVERWRKAVDGAADVLKERGIEIVNCSPDSALKNYPKMTLEESLNGHCSP